MSAPSGAAVAIEALRPGDDSIVSGFYREILQRHFRPDELDSEEEFSRLLGLGTAKVLVARLADGSLAGGMVADWYERCEVLQLSYLAVPVRYRGLGIGSRLLAAISTEWSANPTPRLMIAEVEDPRFYHSDKAFGHPAERLRLYAKFGARALPVPYLQPALGPGMERVRHLMLMVFGGSQAPAGATRVDGRTVERFLTEYYAIYDDPMRPDDAEVQRMLAACRRTDGLPLLRVGELPPLDETGPASDGAAS